jgi:hypothetical protein
MAKGQKEIIITRNVLIYENINLNRLTPSPNNQGNLPSGFTPLPRQHWEWLRTTPGEGKIGQGVLPNPIRRGCRTYLAKVYLLLVWLVFIFEFCYQ